MSPSVTVARDMEMKTRDSIVLRADIFRPNVREKVPALVARTPYDKGTYFSRLLPPLDAAWAGFAVVVQDVRGRFASDGDWDLLQIHETESRDGFDCIEWVASEPWCDGNIGMFGPSYLGEAQIYAASARPPSLKAIAPAVTGAGEDSFRRHSMVLESIVVGWMAGRAVDLLQKRMPKGDAHPDDLTKIMEALRDPGSASRTFPLNDLLTLKTPGLPTYSQFVDILRRTSTGGRRSGGEIAVPALWTSGWYDETGGTELFQQMRRAGAAPAARTDTRLILGPWSHNYFETFVGQLGLGNFASAQGAGVSKAHIDFFRRHLRGDDIDLPVARYFVMGLNIWKQADDWPIPGTTRRRYYLRSKGNANTASGEGVLSEHEPHSEESPDRYRYDPADPVPSFGVRVMYSGGSTVAGPFDQTRVERRRDVLVYTSEALTRPLEVVGTVELHLFVSSSAPDTDFVAKLCVVDRDGNSTNLADGSMRARWRRGWEEATFLEPDQVVDLRIDLGLTGYHFSPGDHIRLQVTSSCFPHLERNMNTGNEPGADVEGVVAEQTVWHTREFASHVVLPVQP